MYARVLELDELKSGCGWCGVSWVNFSKAVGNSSG